VTATGGTLSNFVAVSPTVYTAVFTPTAGATSGAVAVAAGSFTDANGNQSLAGGLGTAITIDNIAPTVTITSPSSTLRNGQTAQLTFTLSEAITAGSFTAADVAVTGGTIGALTGSGTVFTTTFTPTANFSGNAAVSVGASAFTDAAGNDNTAATPLSITVDTLAPTVAITSSVSSVASGSTANITFTLSEASTDFAASDVTVTNGSLSSFTSVSATVYTATFTPNAGFSGAANITVPAGSFSDAAGNVSTAAGSLALAVNTVSPTVTVTSSAATLRNNQTALITFTLSSASTSFTAADFTAVAPAVANVTATGGTLSNFVAVSPTVYTAVFTPTAGATSGAVAVAAGSFTDANGNQSLAGGLGTAITIDNIAPTVTITSPSSTLRNGQTAQLTFTLSEAITAGSFTAADVAVTGGTIGALTGSGTVFTTTFTPTANFSGNAAVTVGASAFTDAAGNDNTAATPLSITVDTLAPTVAITSSVSSVASGSTANITFTLSEASTDFAASDVTVTNGSLSSFTSVSATVYTATFTPNAGFSGAANITVPAGSFSDAAGNVSTAAGSLALAVNTVSPTVTVTSSAATLRNNQTALITFTLSSASTSFTAADFTAVAPAVANVTATGGTLSNFVAVSPTVYTAVFTPTAGATSGAVAVAAGSFTDANGNQSLAGGLGTAITIDNIAPTVTITSPSSTLRNGQTAQLTFTLSEAITAGSFTAADVAVTGGTIGALTGSGTVFTTTFTPTANFSGNAAVTVGASAFTDAAGNDNTAATPLSITVDTLAPTVAITSSVSSVASGSTANITFTLSEASTDFAASDVTVTNGSLSSFTSVSATVYTATFTPNAGFSGAANITVPAGSFSDAAGNVSTAAGSLALAVNTVSPTVTVTSSAATLRNNQTALITFTLSSASTSFTAADFTAVAPAVANVTATGGTLSNFVAVSPTVYTAVFTPTAGATSGAVAVAAGSFTDANGNQSLAGGLGTAITIDNIAPTVTITSPSSTLRNGQTAQLTFTLSEAITAGSFTAADVAVTGGTIGALTGSGTVFTTTFTPTANFSGNAAVTVGASAFTDAAGNDNTAATPLSITVDTLAPTVAITSSVSSVASGSTANITFTLSEASTDFAASDVTVTNGSLSSFTSVSATVYTATFTPNAGFTGAATVAVAAGAFTDAAGNNNTAGTLALAVNTVSPTVSITSNSSTLKSNQTATITFTLSSASNSFDPSVDTVVTGGTLSGFAAVSASVYTAIFTPTTGTTGTISVAAGSFTDNAGNQNLAGSMAPITIDTVAPTVTIAATPTTVRAGQTAQLTFTLSEASTTFTTADVTATGGTVSGFAGSGTVYTALFTPTANFSGNAAVSVGASAFTDAAGNDNAAATPLSITVDTLAPTVAITSSVSSVASGSTANITFTLSEASTDFAASDVTVTNGSLSSFTSVSATVYTATFTPNAGFTGAATVAVAAGAFTDAAGNNNTAGTLALAVNTVSPTVSITSNSSTLKSNQTATITFTLSSASNSFDPSVDTVVTGGTLSGFAAVSASVYTAIFTPTTGTTGTISVAAGSFTDNAGNQNLAGSMAPITIDTVAPTVTIAATPTTVRAGQTAQLTFTLSEASTTFTTADVTATGGTVSGFAGSGTVYTALFTPTANFSGNAAVSVGASAFTDAAGNDNAAATPLSITVDTLAPTVAITSSVSSVASGSTATITFTLSEASTDFAASDVTVTNGSLSSFTSVSATVYTATFTPNAGFTGAATVAVAAGAFTDAAGNNNTAGTLALAVNTVSPTVSITSNSSTLKSNQTATITFTLSSASNSFDPSVDTVVTGGTLSGFAAVSASVYTAIFTPTTGTTGTISVAAGSFTDNAGNQNLAGSMAPITIDTVAPTVTIAATPTTVRAGQTAQLTFTLSEASTTFTTADVTATGGTVSGFAGSGTVYTALFTPTANFSGNAAVSVGASAFTDAAGNDNAAATPLSITVDTVVPTVVGISPPAGIVYATGDILTFNLTPSEAVTVVGAPKLSLSIGSATRQADYVPASSTATSLVFSYTVQASDTSTTGIAANAVSLGGATIRDAAGNDANLTFSPASVIGAVVNRTALTGVTVGPAKTNKIGDVIELTATFSQPVTVTGSPTIALAVGSAPKTATYISGTGTSSIKFRYTVAAGDLDTDGIDVPGLVIVGGSIVDAGGNSVSTTFPAPANLANVKVDGVAPTVSVTPPAGGAYNTGDTLSVSVAFNDTVTYVKGALDATLPITIGTNIRQSVYDSASSTSTTSVFKYTIQAADSSAGAISLGQIALNGSTIRDADGNDANLAFVPSAITNVVINRLSATVTVNSSTYKIGDAIDLVATFGGSVTVTGTPTIALTVGTASKTATYISGTGTSTIKFRYTVIAGDLDTDGIDVPSLAIVGGSITDAGGSAVATTFTAPANLANVLVDGVAPSVSGVAQPAVGFYATTAKLEFAVTFNDVVTVVTTGGTPSLPITIGGITRQARYDAAVSSGSTVVFTYTIVPGDSATGLAGSVTVGSTIALNGGTIRDVNLNDAAIAVPPTTVSNVIINRLAATVAASADKTYKLGDVIELTATFPQPVNVVGAASIQATVNTTSGPKTAAFLYASGTGTHTLKFRYTVVANDLDTDGIDVNGTFTLGAGVSMKDLANNDVVLAFANTPDTSKILVDGVAPSAMTAIVGPTPGTYLAANNDVLRFTVPFNDIVTVTGSSLPSLAFTLGSNTRQAQFAGTSGFSGNVLEFTYAVRNTDTGTRVSVASNAISLNGATITDANSNAAITAISATTFDDVIVNQAIITNVSLASTDNRYYRAGETVFFDVAFSSSVTVSGTPSLSLALQSGNVAATFLSGSGTATLRFAYRVVNGDLDPDGMQFSTTTIALNGGTILAAGGPVTLSFLAPDISGVRIDAQSPTIVGSIAVPAAGTYRAGDVLPFTVTLSESMTVAPEAVSGNVPQIAMVIGSRTRYANYVAGSDTNILQFEYLVANDDLDTNGIVVSSAIQLNGARLTDVAGNNSGLTFTVPSTTGILIDGVAPTVTRFSTTQPNGLYTVGAVIPLVATLSESVAAGSTIEVTLDTGAVVALTAATAGKSLTGNYVVAASQTTADLDVSSYVDVSTVDLAGNPLGGTTLPTGANNLAGSKQIAIDTTAPTVTAFSSTTPAGTYGVGATIAIRATVSEPVKAGGTISAMLDTGATVVLTAVTQGTTLTGSLLVTAGQNTSALTVVSLLPGTAVDLAGNAIVDTTLPTGVISDAVTIGIDTTAPTVVSFSSTTTDGSYIAGSPIAIIATLSEPVTAGSMLGVTLDTGRSVTLIAATAGTTLSGVYTVAAGDSSPDLKVASFTAGTVTDLVGNRLTSTAVPANNIDVSKAIVVDALGPSVTVTSDKASVGGPDTATITFSLDESGTLVDATKIVTIGGTLSSVTGSGTTFSARFTPTANSTTPATITVQPGAFADMLSNLSRAGAISTPITVDTVAPTVTIAADKTALKAGETAAITFTLSEPSTTFTVDDLTLIDGTVSDFMKVSDTVYTAIFTPTPDKLAYVQVQVLAGKFTDAAGNSNEFGRWYVLSDTLRPTVSIATSTTALKSGDTARITFTLSESATDFTEADVLATGGMLTGFTGSGRIYSATFIPTANSTAPGVVSIAANTFTDSAGNANTAGALDTAITIDTIAPTVTITADKAALKAGETARLEFTLSEPSTSFTAEDLTLIDGTISDFKKETDSFYTAIFTPTPDKLAYVQVQVLPGKFTDAAGNGNVFGRWFVLSDTALPSTVRITGDRTALKAGDTARVTFSLSESTTDFTMSDVVVTGGTLSGFTGSGTSYSAVFTPTTNSTAPGTFLIPAGSFQDAAGNPNTAFGPVAVFSIDTVPPNVAISSNKTSLKIGETATISFTIDESTTDFTASDVVVTGGVLSEFTGAGKTYSAVFTPAADSAAPGTISIPAGSLTDAAGNGNVAGMLTLPITIDTLAPTVAITSDQSALKIGETATIFFTLSEPSTNFSVDDLTATNGMLSGFAGSGGSYKVVFTPVPNFSGVGMVTVAANKFTDAAGNPNVAGSLATAIRIDTIAPTVTITADKTSLKAGETARLEFTLSEPSTTFTTDDLTLIDGTISDFKKETDSFYTAIFTPTPNKLAYVQVQVIAGKFTDAAGNGNVFGRWFVLSDTTFPTIAITSDKPALKGGDTARITFSLSEATTDFSLADVAVTGGTVSGLTGAGAIYSAVFTPTANSTAPGTISVAANKFTDAAGNGNIAGSLAAAIRIDTVAPTVTITADKSALKAGDTTLLTFTLSEPATNFTVDDLTLIDGTVSDFRKVSDTVYTAVFTPTAGKVAYVQVQVAAGKFTDAAGNGNEFGRWYVLSDTLRPAVTITGSKAALKAGETATINFALSKPSTNFALDDVTVAGGTLSDFKGSGASYSATFTPTANSTTAGSFSVAAGRFTDSVGNDNVPGSLITPVRIDTVPPTVSITADKTALKAGETATITFTLSEPSANFTADDLTLIDGTVSNFRKVSDTVYSATFTPAADKVAYVQVQVLAGTFTDAAGNGNVFGRWFVLSDTVRPTVVGFSTSAPSGSYPAGTVIGLTATISEPVKAGSAFAVTLNTGAVITLRANVDGSSLSGDYVVADGQNTSLLAATSYTAGSVVDLAGNPLAVAAVPAGRVGALAAVSNIGASIAIDTLRPVVAGFSAGLPNGTYGTGATIPLTATLSEAVQAGAAIQVTLNTGAVVRLGANANGTTLTGSYVVQPGDGITRLDVIAYQTVATVRDLAGNALTSTALPSGPGQLAAVQAIAIDATLQLIPPAGFSTDATSIPDRRTAVTAIPINFSTPVTGVSLPAFRLLFNGRSLSLRGASVVGSGANYTLRLPSKLTNLKGIYTLQILPTSGIRAAANGAALSHTLQLYWGNGRSVGTPLSSKALAFARR
jgi:large repetitive protein